MMDFKSVQNAVNMLAGSLHMRMDYNNFNTGDKKLLIVEGQTDESFIKNQVRDDVVCLVANKAFNFRGGLGPQATVNHKNAIIQVVYGLSVYPAIIKCPKGSENWKVYGMIDMDFDDPGDNKKTTHLFITDTHDLETLMLSTDDTLLQRIEGCVISQDDSNKALFLAYQLGKLRTFLFDYISVKPISAGSKEVDYSKFIQDGYRLSLSALFSYINQEGEEKLSSAKEKRLIARLLKDKEVKKYTDSSGCWKADLEKFDILATPDFWEVVNGHDILALLRYVNADAALKFRKKPSYTLNRDFEMSLIKAYDMANFKKTRICSDMISEQIVDA